jgi:LPS sulfotransferase NodH
MEQGPMLVTCRSADDVAEVRTSGLIATLPRSGSWLLSEALQLTGLVGQPAEYFRPDFLSQFSREWGLADGVDLREYVARSLIRTASDSGVFTNKFHWYQFAWFIEQLRNLDRSARSDGEWVDELFPDPRWIHLIRVDKGRQAVSYYRASESQVWFSGDPSGAQRGADEPTEPHFQQIRYLEDVLVNHEAQWTAFFSDNGVKPLTIVYEDLVSSFAETISLVHEHLGVFDLDVPRIREPRLRRQADDVTERWYERYRELRNSLQPLTPDLAWSPETKTYETRNGRARALGSRAPDPESLPDSARQWIATSAMVEVQDDQIVETLVARGFGAEAVRAELVQLRRHPYFLGAFPLTQRLLKTDSLLEMTRRLSDLTGRRGPPARQARVRRDEFLKRFYAANRPLVLDGVVSDMRASAWTPQYLRERCEGAEIEIMSDRDADPEYEIYSGRHRSKIRMDEYIDNVLDPAGSNDRYLVANNFFFNTEIGRALLDELRPLPDFLSPDEKGDATYLWLGPKGTVTPLHHDVINIFYFQLYGRKQFILAAPEEIPYVYNRQGVYSDVDPEIPDTDAFPHYQRIHTTTITLEQGQALFVPVGWWHHVRSMDVSISVSTTSFCFENRYGFFTPKRRPS